MLSQLKASICGYTQEVVSLYHRIYKHMKFVCSRTYLEDKKHSVIWKKGDFVHRTGDQPAVMGYKEPYLEWCEQDDVHRYKEDRPAIIGKFTTDWCYQDFDYRLGDQPISTGGPIVRWIISPREIACEIKFSLL